MKPFREHGVAVGRAHPDTSMFGIVVDQKRRMYCKNRSRPCQGVTRSALCREDDNPSPG